MFPKVNAVYLKGFLLVIAMISFITFLGTKLYRDALIRKQKNAVTLFNKSRLEGNSKAAQKAYESLIETSSKLIDLSQEGTLLYKTLDEADDLSAAGDFDAARVKYLSAISLGYRTRHAYDPDAAYAMNRYSLSLESRGEFDEAEHLLEQASELRKNNSSKDFIDRMLPDNLGNIFTLRGDYPQAIQKFQETILVDKILLGNNQVSCRATAKLLDLFNRTKRYSEISLLLKPFIDNRSTLIKEDPLAVVIVENALAKVYTEQGVPEEAEKNYRSALEILCKNQGFPDPYKSNSLERRLWPDPTIAGIQQSISSLKLRTIRKSNQ